MGWCSVLVALGACVLLAAVGGAVLLVLALTGCLTLDLRIGPPPGRYREEHPHNRESQMPKGFRLDKRAFRKLTKEVQATLAKEPLLLPVRVEQGASVAYATKYLNGDGLLSDDERRQLDVLEHATAHGEDLVNFSHLYGDAEIRLVLDDVETLADEGLLKVFRSLAYGSTLDSVTAQSTAAGRQRMKAIRALRGDVAKRRAAALSSVLRYLYEQDATTEGSAVRLLGLPDTGQLHFWGESFTSEELQRAGEKLAELGLIAGPQDIDQWDGPWTAWVLQAGEDCATDYDYDTRAYRAAMTGQPPQPSGGPSYSFQIEGPATVQTGAHSNAVMNNGASRAHNQMSTGDQASATMDVQHLNAQSIPRIEAVMAALRAAQVEIDSETTALYQGALTEAESSTTTTTMRERLVTKALALAGGAVATVAQQEATAAAQALADCLKSIALG